MESVSDGFALFDPDDRMVMCNGRFKELNPDLARILAPGITFEQMLRDNIAHGRIVDALEDTEAFIRRRMEQFGDPGGPTVQQRQDGRWLEIREYRMADGSTFLVNTDITELRAREDARMHAHAHTHTRIHTHTRTHAHTHTRTHTHTHTRRISSGLRK